MNGNKVARHTTGPWKYEKVVMSKYGIDAYFEVKQDREDDESVGMFARDVCQTIMREIDSEAALLAEDEANVSLIARAPELLERVAALEKALRWTLNWIQELSDSGDAGFWETKDIPEFVSAKALLGEKRS